MLTMASVRLAVQSDPRSQWLIFCWNSSHISGSVEKYLRGLDNKGSSVLHEDTFTALFASAMIYVQRPQFGQQLADLNVNARHPSSFREGLG